MLKLIPVCALMLLGAGCTTVAPLTPFPKAPHELMQKCQRPAPLPQGKEAPKAAEVLATVTANYARHHSCADLLDGLQGWVKAQESLK